MSFEQAFAEFVVAFDRNQALQARCMYESGIDPAQCVYVRYLLTVASEAMEVAALKLPAEPRR